jgi:hypothetical protein
MNANVAEAFWAELEKIASWAGGIADPILRRWAQRGGQQALKGTARRGKGKGREVLKALKARQGKTRGGLADKVRAESPEATMERMLVVDPRTGEEVITPGLQKAYGGRGQQAIMRGMREVRETTPAWEAARQTAPTQLMMQRTAPGGAAVFPQGQAAAQARLQQAARVAPPRTATPPVPAVGAAPVQPVGSGVLGSIRQRLFGTGNLQGVKTASVLTPLEAEAMRRELSLILG